MSKIILCGADAPEALVAALDAYADRVAVMPRCPDIPGAVSSHPDMLGFARGNRLWLARGYYRANRAFFDGLGCEISVCPVEYGAYPRDVFFNLIERDGAVYGRVDVAPADILEGRAAVAVKQGYARCSTLVSDGGCVTADAGIADALEAHGARVLRIRAGGVTLPGYGCGFIGGACAVPSPDAVIPAGDLDTHPDGKAVRRFIAEAGACVVDLFPAGTPLFDCGGVLTLQT